MIAACPATPVQTPASERRPAPIAGLPWVQASNALAGVVFTWHGGARLELPVGGMWADGASAKVLWWPWRRGAGRVLVLRGRSNDDGATFQQRFPAASTGFPSIVKLPSEGCWTLTLASGSLHGQVVVRAVSQ
jgi:hypothetical protein